MWSPSRWPCFACVAAACCRPAAAGRASRTGSGPPHAVHQQPQADRAGHAQLSRCVQSLSRRLRRRQRRQARCTAGAWPCCRFWNRPIFTSGTISTNRGTAPAISQLAQQMPDVFRCPSVPVRTRQHGDQLRGDRGRSDGSPPQSMFLPNHWTNFRDDATERATPSWSSKRPLLSPGRSRMPTPRSISSCRKSSGIPAAWEASHPGGANVALADGSVRFLSSETRSATAAAVDPAERWPAR